MLAWSQACSSYGQCDWPKQGHRKPSCKAGRNQQGLWPKREYYLLHRSSGLFLGTWCIFPSTWKLLYFLPPDRKGHKSKPSLLLLMSSTLLSFLLAVWNDGTRLENALNSWSQLSHFWGITANIFPKKKRCFLYSWTDPNKLHYIICALPHPL